MSDTKDCGEPWEAWGGPLDGEVLTMHFGQYDMSVYRHRKSGTVTAWPYRGELPRVEDQEFIGVYRWTDPSRLGWVPKEANRHA
jgi:hypothetical protein